jgi:hypothetical protein
MVREMKMIRKLLLGLAFAGFVASPAFAGFNLMCSGDGIEADFPLGGGVGLSLLGATITVGDAVWSTDPAAAGATLVAPHQSANIDDRTYVDLADPNYERIVARLRLFEVIGYENGVRGGVLEIVDVGAWPVRCDVG